MKKIQLYISGILAERGEGEFLQMNYTREDLSNPTIVRNSYSQKITLLATPQNETIFRGFCRYDNTRSPQSFDALKRVPFEIRNDLSEIIESGYAKLESVSRKGAELASYTLTLYGGLGAFFYSMTYKASGEKKTLADLVYPYSSQGQESILNPSTFPMPMTSQTIALAWRLLDDAPGTRNEFDVLNFAPCYNGLPSCKFDADKAVYKDGGTIATRLSGIPLATRQDGVDYTTRSDAGGYALLQFANKHTEQEVQDLRAYLQRPILNLRAFLSAITNPQNTEGWKVVLSDKLSSPSYRYLSDTWMTLPLFDRDAKQPLSAKASDLLAGTKSPAEYLVALAKTLGWVFLSDKTHKEIRVMTRSEFYSSGETIDLTPLVDTQKEITLLPYIIEDKFYTFSADNYGEAPEGYAEKYGRAYGSQTIDTGFDFNAETKNLLDGYAFRGGAQVLEGSEHFRVWGATPDGASGSYQNYELKFAHSEQVTYQLYGMKNGETLTLDLSPTANGYAPFWYNKTRKGYDVFSRLQLHKADNKGESGEGVLLFYNGKKALPTYETGGVQIAEVVFHLSNDNASMLALNDGVPCWDVTPRVTGSEAVLSLPMFARWDDEEMPNYSFDFGVPREVYAPEVDYDNEIPVYTQQWAVYIQDRFSANTRVMTCYADLTGFVVGEDLFRCFWYFGGSVWVLNKISNYNYGFSQTTKCEFVKVNDKTAYTFGQNE